MHEKQVWTNRSVVRLMEEASGLDPVQVVTDKTREIVLKAIDGGWSGPPYDPVDLANKLKIDVRPNDNIVDAQTTPVGDESFRIEFNPNRPPARVRYSIAHEIAHTIFPDCAEEVRERSSRSGKVDDAWQLETLCNIGAAELIMPLGQLGDVADRPYTIEEVAALREKLGVSTEAIVIRLIHLTGVSAMAFAASHLDSGTSKGRYRLDYVIPSRTWSGNKMGYGDLLPKETLVSNCTAIGFTSKGEEVWGGETDGVHVECMGIPPYPWSRLPRVVGLVFNKQRPESGTPLFQKIRGDALEPRGEGPKLIVHVVNTAARTWGGGGIAQAMRNMWPDVHQEFKELAADRRNLELGRVHFHHAHDDVYVADMVAQVGYGPKSTGPRLRYSALRDCLLEAGRKAKELGATIHMPRIGAGNAGGSWPVIEHIVRTTLCEDDISVTVYDLPNVRSRREKDGQLMLDGL